MSMFTGCPIIKDETMVDVDTITAYIRDYRGGGRIRRSARAGADYDPLTAGNRSGKSARLRPRSRPIAEKYYGLCNMGMVY